MDNIKINVIFPKATEIKRDLDNVLKSVGKESSIKLDLDISDFSKSIGEISQNLAKLKAQIGGIKGLENIIEVASVNASTKAIERQTEAIKNQQKTMESVVKTSNTKMIDSNGNESIIKDLETIRDEYGNLIEVVNKYDAKTGELKNTFVTTTNEIEKQEKQSEKALKSIENLKNGLQNKLNSTLGNQNFNLIDDSVFTSLQTKINSINTNTPEKEINELKVALSNLNSSDGQIIRLQNVIEKNGIAISSLKDKYKDLVPENELKIAEDRINTLKNALQQIQSSGGGYSKSGISSMLNDASSSMKSLTNATKNASEEQRLYNKEVVTFGSAFRDASAKVGVYSLVYAGINQVQNAFRDGIQSVIDMNTALVDLNKVVDLSNSQLLEMRDSSVKIGEELGASALDIAKAQAELGKQYKDTNQINEMVRVSTIGANVMDITSSEVAKGLTTIINSLKLNMEDATTIIDSLNQVQNNYRVDSSEMLSALSKIGSTASVAGASLQQLEGYIASLSVSTGKTGDEIGESLKSITSRIYKIGSEGIESEGKPEKMLQDMGVAVRDLEGNFRPLNEILSDLSVKWKTMTETQKIATAQVVAGQHKYNDFISLLNNFDMATEATATAMDSLNSASIENEKYLQSIEGRMASLKATMQGFALNFISSDLIKDIVSSFQLLVNSLNGLQSTFGSLGISVGALTTAFLVFTNNPLKQFSKSVIENGSFTKTFSTNLTDLIGNLTKTATANGRLNDSMTKSQRTTALLKEGIVSLGSSALATQIKVIALQTALSIGIGLAVTAVIGGISKLVDKLILTRAELDELNETSKQALNDNNSLVSSVEELIKKEEELKNKLSAKGNTYEEQKEYRIQLLEVQKQIADILPKSASAFDAEGNKISGNTDKVLENLDAKKKLSEREALDAINNNNRKGAIVDVLKLYKDAKEEYEGMQKAYELNEEYQGKRVTNNMLEKLDKKIKEYEGTIETIQPAIKTLLNLDWGEDRLAKELFPNLPIDMPIEKIREAFNELTSIMDDYMGSVDEANESQDEFNKNQDIGSNSQQVQNVSLLQESYEKLGYSVEDAKKKVEELNGLSVDDSNAQILADSTTAYGEAISKTKELEELINDVNEAQSLSPELIMQIASAYPEIGVQITSVAGIQEFLNKKISESVDAQANAYRQMTENDNTYYSTKIANNDGLQQNFNSLLSAFVTNSGKAYSTDLDNYSSLAQLKAKLTNEYGETVAQLITDFVSSQASGYDVDLDKQNCPYNQKWL